MTFLVNDTSRDNDPREVETYAEAEETKNDMVSLGANPDDLEITEKDGVDAEIIDHSPDTDESDETTSQPPESVETDTQTTEVIDSTEQLAKDPIAWLESQNTDFVNTIKGKPAISKQGFRFIQSKFGITTESKVVETFDDPTGVIVWAKAELPDGQCAEAHGEGYLSERDVDDNEFVRYADTRAKNRAISDLTSAGALAVSELSQ